MARTLCNRCQYPINHCLCSTICSIEHNTRVVILQHPSEVKNAKNTVRLLNLMSDNISLHIGESSDDFEPLKQEIKVNPEQYALLFPSPQAINLDHNSEQLQDVKHLIVIDGTWKKAKKILFENPWLEQVLKVSFDQVQPSQYQIRATKIEGGLSTIEAVACALQYIEQTDPEPFITALNGLKHSFTKSMPEHVKARYKG